MDVFGNESIPKKSFSKNIIFAIHSQIGKALYLDYIFAQNDRVVVHNIF